MTGLRTPGGGLIDRTQSLRFTFDGQTYQGAAGDTLASALLANGVHLTGRSFKYHRPRGILAAGSEEPNALVTVSRDAARVTLFALLRIEQFAGFLPAHLARGALSIVLIGRFGRGLSASAQ